MLRHLLFTPLPPLCQLDLWEAGITASKISNLPLVLQCFPRCFRAHAPSRHRIFSVSDSKSLLQVLGWILTADAPGSQQRALLPTIVGFGFMALSQILLLLLTSFPHCGPGTSPTPLRFGRCEIHGSLGLCPCSQLGPVAPCSIFLWKYSPGISCAAGLSVPWCFSPVLRHLLL